MQDRIIFLNTFSVPWHFKLTSNASFGESEIFIWQKQIYCLFEMIVQIVSLELKF
jgi:hypothetical protein